MAEEIIFTDVDLSFTKDETITDTLNTGQVDAALETLRQRRWRDVKRVIMHGGEELGIFGTSTAHRGAYQSSVTCDDILKAKKNIEGSYRPDIQFSPYAEIRVQTDHPRKLLKRKKLEPLWLFTWRQTRANAQHGFYYVMEPQIYEIDLDIAFGFGLLSAPNRTKRIVAHSVYQDILTQPNRGHYRANQ